MGGRILFSGPAGEDEGGDYQGSRSRQGKRGNDGRPGTARKPEWDRFRITFDDGGTLRLGVHCAGGRVRILIENPLDPESAGKPGSGLGLANVRKRLTARYGSDGLFAARRLTDSFLVVISVPAELAV